MEREILFRGKRTDNKEWVYGSLISRESTDRCFIVDNSNETALRGCVTHEADKYDWRSVEVYGDTVCQYAGLNDIDDMGIFEGDICDFSTFDYNGHDTQWRGVVVYSGSRFMLWKSKDCEYYGSDGGFDLDYIHSNDDEIKIVGNIFDNPELLKD